MAFERGAGRYSSRRSTLSVTPAAPGGAPELGAFTGHAAFSRPSQRPPVVHGVTAHLAQPANTACARLPTIDNSYSL